MSGLKEIPPRKWPALGFEDFISATFTLKIADFYKNCPKIYDFTSYLLDDNLEELLHIAKTLGLKSFQSYVEKDLIERSGGCISKWNLEALIIAEKYELFKYIKEQFDTWFGGVLEAFHLIKDPSFTALNRETRYEILKASVIFPFKYNSKAKLGSSQTKP